MLIQEVIVLIIACFLAAVIVLVPKLIFKKWLTGWMWVFPISLILGYVLMYSTTNEDSILHMLKENLIWAFVVSMIVINIKFLISGTKNRVTNSKTFFGDIKSELKKMKPNSKKKKDSDENTNDEE